MEFSRIIAPRKTVCSPHPLLGWCSRWMRSVWVGGAFLHPLHLSGTWSPLKARSYFYFLELRAVFLAPQGFVYLVTDQSVLIRSDYSTVVSYINLQSGTHSVSPCGLTLVLLEWCLEKNVHLSAAHVPGEDNLIAVFLSRGNVLPSEWSLKNSVFRQICLIFPRPEIHLFAPVLAFFIGGSSEESAQDPGHPSPTDFSNPSCKSKSFASHSLAYFRQRGQEAGLSQRAAEFAAIPSGHRLELLTIPDWLDSSTGVPSHRQFLVQPL